MRCGGRWHLTGIEVADCLQQHVPRSMTRSEVFGERKYAQTAKLDIPNKGKANIGYYM